MSKIVLATSSPYRRNAFELLDIDFEAESSDVDEYFDGRPDNPTELVKHLAKLKSEAVAEDQDKKIVIGFDSVGYFNGEILEKPESREEATRRLKSVAGNSFKFYTGVHMYNVETGKKLSRAVKTRAKMRELNEKEIKKYLEQDNEYKRKALGFDPLNYYSCTFIEKIEGSYFNILQGIPLETIAEMLPEVGYEL